jgi:hypothetical protein
MIIKAAILTILQLISVKSISPYTCGGFLDVDGFTGVLDMAEYTNKDYEVIYIVKVYVRDNGEYGGFFSPDPEGDISLAVTEVSTSKQISGRRLYGPVAKGLDDDGSFKYEWNDCCEMRYNNFAISAKQYSIQSNYCISIDAVEGDDVEIIQGGDDRVFYAKVCSSSLPFDEIVQIEADKCDLQNEKDECVKDGHNKCATFWLCRKILTSTSGKFWHDPKDGKKELRKPDKKRKLPPPNQ